MLEEELKQLETISELHGGLMSHHVSNLIAKIRQLQENARTLKRQALEDSNFTHTLSGQVESLQAINTHLVNKLRGSMELHIEDLEFMKSSSKLPSIEVIDEAIGIIKEDLQHIIHKIYDGQVNTVKLNMWQAPGWKEMKQQYSRAGTSPEFYEIRNKEEVESAVKTFKQAAALKPKEDPEEVRKRLGWEPLTEAERERNLAFNLAINLMDHCYDCEAVIGEEHTTECPWVGRYGIDDYQPGAEE